MTLLNELLTLFPELFYTLIVFIGLISGSFLNVVIYRLPKILEQSWKRECEEILEISPTPSVEKMNLWWPRSRCPSCGHAISVFENVPVLSYLLLKGRCSSCKKPISWRYPLVEILTALLSVLVFYQLGVRWQTLYALFFVWGLIALTFIDFEKLILPDDITVPLLWVGLGINAFEIFVSPQSAILGAIAGYVSLWSVYWLFKLLTKKEGMGYGDFKLLALIGAWLGWQMLLLIILTASLSGSVVGITLILLHRQDKNVPIPFGPYLAFAGVVALLWGDPIIKWYLTHAF